MLKDEDSLKKYETLWEVKFAALGAIEDLNTKIVTNLCYGCVFTEKVNGLCGNDCDHFCINCLFDIDLDILKSASLSINESCLNGLWHHAKHAFEVYKCDKTSINEVIKAAEKIRDFPIRKDLYE